ncbi:hypothetical protein Shyhy02_41030 [Streptomyces hygroscopicus subsp. hygroscopicus]|nr:hypothetical protein Shyhy02_41030 [Streptomyces hygroscopicus subsp. hygroscopicus]
MGVRVGEPVDQQHHRPAAQQAAPHAVEDHTEQPQRHGEHGQQRAVAGVREHPAQVTPGAGKRPAVTTAGRVLVDRELYLPTSWAVDWTRCRAVTGDTLTARRSSCLEPGWARRSDVPFEAQQPAPLTALPQYLTGEEGV